MSRVLRKFILAALGIALVAAVAHPAAAQAGERFDILIQNARVFDGSGAPWVRMDVGIRGDRIAAVGNLAGATAVEAIDARGLYLAPGFIDTHSHAGDGLGTEEMSDGRPLIAQGITTVFVNPDGGGAADLVRQRERLLEHGLGVNVAQFVPHGSVRRAVMGMDDRAPTDAELREMEGMVRAGMEAGAFGLASGPFYAPGSYADTDELAALAAVAAEYGGAHQSHIRDEGDFSIGLLAAVDEVIEISRRTGGTGVVTHVKALGPRVWGFSAAVVHRIERAREEGLPIFADQYPYEASATGLSGALAPRWALAGGQDSLLARIARPDDRARLAEDIAENLDRRGGADRIQFRHYAVDPSVEGRTLAQVAAERGETPIETTIHMLAEGGARIVSFNMHDDDVVRLMQQPWTMTASDGEMVPLGEGVPHPRAYGSFPRKIARYAVERGVIDVGTAIRSMTHLPALVYDVPGRGLVRPGMIADLVVFDLGELRDLATFTDPHQYAEGMVHVLVGGRFAIRDGTFTGERAGAVLRHAATHTAELPASADD
jgi:N-acyl-D-amino-acid deacylase